MSLRMDLVSYRYKIGINKFGASKKHGKGQMYTIGDDLHVCSSHKKRDFTILMKTQDSTRPPEY